MTTAPDPAGEGSTVETIRRVLRDALNQGDGSWSRTNAEADRLTALIAGTVDLGLLDLIPQSGEQFGSNWPMDPHLTPIERESEAQAREWAAKVPAGGVVRRVPARTIPAGPWEQVPPGAAEARA